MNIQKIQKTTPIHHKAPQRILIYIEKIID